MTITKYWPSSYEYAWVACSIREFGHVGEERHLIVKKQGGRGYWLTTVCGHSASLEGIWRGNKTKPACTECTSAEEAFKKAKDKKR